MHTYQASISSRTAALQAHGITHMRAAATGHKHLPHLHRRSLQAYSSSGDTAADPLSGPQNNGTGPVISNSNTSNNMSAVNNGPGASSAAPSPSSPTPQQYSKTPQPSSSSGSSVGNGSSSSSSRQRAVVVGGGWAGFGAALALAKAGAHVTLLDASQNPGGLSAAFKTPGGQLVEPGIKGFWYQYANIEGLVSELGIPSPFTPFTRSSFWSPEGLQVDSPIFQDLPRLPTPLGSFIHTATRFKTLPLLDRVSASPLVKPLLEHDLDQQTYTHYDNMSAYELFREAGVSKQLYEAFLAPMLLVTLFAPPTELSAAAALGALYYFALAHQPDFDVRWCKGPIGVVLAKGGPDGGLVERHSADVIVLAAGLPALQQLLLASPVLAAAQDLRGVLGVGCSAVLAVRLWLDVKLLLRSPSNVVAGFDAGVGGTFFQLDALQDMYKDEPGSVIEFDLYHAEPLLPLSDDAIVTRLLETYLAPALPGGIAQAKTLGIRDRSVLRFRNAVTRFSPGSDAQLPAIATSIPNVFVAGDCVRQGPGSHGCKGLSQEKAYVSGLQAGNRAAAWLGLTPVAQVIPVEPDEPHVVAAKGLLRTQRQLEKLTSSIFGRNSSSSSSSSRSGSSSSVKQERESSSSDSGSSSGSRWIVEGSSSEQRARESHALRQLLIEEVTEQAAEQRESERV